MSLLGPKIGLISLDIPEIDRPQRCQLNGTCRQFSKNAAPTKNQTLFKCSGCDVRSALLFGALECMFRGGKIAH
jgi:flavoprotein